MIEYVDSDSIMILEGNIIPIYKSDTIESITDRIHCDDRIPYSKVIKDGKTVLLRDHILHDIFIDFEIKL